MIGFYIFDEKPDVDKQLVLAHSALNEDIKGYFYVRESDCSDISNVDKGSEFFGVLDDASGFGACLFIKDLDVESNALLLQHNLHVKGDSQIDGKLDVNGNIKTNANVTGKSPNTIINLTAAHAALILAAGLSGAPAPLSAVPIIMSNS